MGRTIEYLRLSVTERCNLRCVYCRPELDCPKAGELPPSALERIARAFARLGGNKIRITGGEPLMRRDLEEIIQRIAGIPQYRDIAMTTNGHGLSGRIHGLQNAGLKRCNFSLDSLKPERYAALTGGGDIGEVVEGIDRALALGLHPVKTNTVLVRGENDAEVDDFIALTKQRPIEVRFIELMPIGQFGGDASKHMPSDALIASRKYLKPLPHDTAQPVTTYRADGHMGTVGFIQAVSHRFCDRCNRIRVTSDGNVKTCLGDNTETPLLPALMKDDQALLRVLKEAIYNKHSGHSFHKGYESTRNMNRIGG